MSKRTRTVAQATRKPTRKVTAAATGAGVGTVAANAVLWGLDALFWAGDAPPDVPGPVAAVVLLVVPAVAALGAGYMRRELDGLAPDGGPRASRGGATGR